MSAPRTRSYRATTRPSSPDHAPRAHARQRDKRHRTPRDQSSASRPAHTTRDGPHQANPANSAATTTPAPDHKTESSGAYQAVSTPPRTTKPAHAGFVQQPPVRGFPSAPERTRTSTDHKVHKALNLARLPIPPQALEAASIASAGRPEERLTHARRRRRGGRARAGLCPS